MSQAPQQLEEPTLTYYDPSKPGIMEPRHLDNKANPMRREERQPEPEGDSSNNAVSQDRDIGALEAESQQQWFCP